MAKHKRGAQITPSEKKEVRDLLERDKSPLEIARETGISQSKVYDLKRIFRPTLHLPHGREQERLFEQCQTGDHSWMAQASSDIVCREEIIGSCFVAEGALNEFHSRTRQEQFKHPLQPRIKNLGDTEPLQSEEKEAAGTTFPILCEVVTCWFCDYKNRTWSWQSDIDRAVESSGSRFEPTENDLKKLGIT